MQHPIEERDNVEWQNCEEVKISMDSITTEEFRDTYGCLFVGILRTTGASSRLVFAKWDQKTIGDPPTRAIFLFAGPHILDANNDAMGKIASLAELTNQYGCEGFHPCVRIHDWYLVQFPAKYFEKKMEWVYARIFMELRKI
jgi:hypothetical protein